MASYHKDTKFSQSSQTKHSSLSLVNELITNKLNCGDTEINPCFRVSKKQIPVYNKLAKFLELTFVKPDVVMVKGLSVYSALYFTRAVLEVFSECLPKVFLRPLEEQLYIFVVAKSWPIKKFVKNAKYFTCYPFARLLQQRREMPEFPESYVDPAGRPLHHFIFKGWIRRWLKQRVIVPSDKNIHLFGSILLGVKRACYRVPDEFIIESYQKHGQILSQEPSVPAWIIRYNYTSYVERALAFVQPIKKYKLYEASTSACWERKVSEGGQREVVRSFINFLENRSQSVDQLALFENDLREMYLGQDHKIHEVREVDTSDLIEEVYDKYKDTSYLKVMVHALPEPLKVRNITKGEALPYYLSIHFQKSMWSYLQQFKQFSPTGKPLEVQDLRDLASRMRALESRLNINLNFNSYVSGDYSAATDGVDFRMTMMIYDKFAEKFCISDKLNHILRMVIGAQEIHYPDYAGVSPFLQKNGQLMGSTLSFPILCLINVIAYWKAMEMYTGSNIELAELPVLVNGDDILFPANEAFYNVWKSCIADVGFNLSLGKNYRSDKVCTMNSMMFRILPNDDFRYIPFLNVGLLTGVSKHFGRINDRLKPITSIYNQLIEGSFNKVNCHNHFMFYNKKAIEQYTVNGSFNLFIPWDKGGLGFKNDEVKKPRITPFQRLFASWVNQDVKGQMESNGKITRVGLIEFQQNKYEKVAKLHGIPDVRLMKRSELEGSNGIIDKSRLPEGYILYKEWLEQFSVKEDLTVSYDFEVQPEFKIKVPHEFSYWYKRWKLTSRNQYKTYAFKIDKKMRRNKRRADLYLESALRELEALEQRLEDYLNYFDNPWFKNFDRLPYELKVKILGSNHTVSHLINNLHADPDTLFDRIQADPDHVKRMQYRLQAHLESIKEKYYSICWEGISKTDLELASKSQKYKITHRISNDEILDYNGFVPVVCTYSNDEYTYNGLKKSLDNLLEIDKSIAQY